MDKSQHTVTVPREYLEMLEGVHQDVLENEYTLSGKVRRNGDFGKILFIKENALTKQDANTIIVIDEIGKERLVYHLVQKLVD